MGAAAKREQGECFSADFFLSRRFPFLLFPFRARDARNGACGVKALYVFKVIPLKATAAEQKRGPPP